MTATKEDILNLAYEKGKKYELENGDCAQCTLAAVFEVLGIEDEGVFRATTALADGLGLSTNGHCGALSGGAMAIGYLFGRKSEDFNSMKKLVKANLLTKRLHDWYLEKYGTIRCADVQQKLGGTVYDMYNPSEMERAVKDGFFDISSSVVGETARMTAQIILEERERMAAKEKA
jgi:C_GCAxxG_C_C family probable redox protein